MELRQLEHFVAAAEEGHFGRAADRANIVQSGLSASIRSLERELGTRLFDRTTRRVELTESGRALLTEARRVLGAAAAAREAVAGVEGLQRGTLSLGIMQSLGAVQLPALLARFHSIHPGVDIRLRQAGTTVLLREVREGRLELAFASLPETAPAGLVGHELLSEAMMLACAPEHPLAERDSVSLASLQDQPFVDSYPEWGMRIANDRAFAVRGDRAPRGLRGQRHADSARASRPRPRGRDHPAIARAASHATAFRPPARQAAALERDPGRPGAHGAERREPRIPRDGHRRGRLGRRSPWYPVIRVPNEACSSWSATGRLVAAAGSVVGRIARHHAREQGA